MHLLHQQFGDLVETETTGTLQQNHLITQTAERSATDELVYRRETPFLANSDHIAMLANFRSDTDKFLHSTLYSQVANFTVKLCGIFPTLENIAQYQRAAASLMIWPTVHKVERDVKRIEIRIVGIIDERASMPSFLNLQSHGNRFQLHHPLVELVGLHAQLQCHNSRYNGIGDTCVVDERNAIPALFATFIYIGNGRGRRLLLYRLDIHGGLAVFCRPT